MMEMLGDHLWQSTICAGAIALLTLAFRRNRAHVRYGLWLAASIKFLVPFAALIALGNQIGWRTELAAVPDLTLAVSTAAQPFTSPGVDLVALADSPEGERPVRPAIARGLIMLWAAGGLAIAALWAVRWRRVARAVRLGEVVTNGRVLHTLRRLEQDAGVQTPIALVASAGTLEPGVFGILRPILLWPSRIDGRLSDASVEAILAHEIAHVRRRDNLASGAHMIVQAIFWFHPLVWWLSARLLDERERACDEEVILLGSAPDVYAEGILETVRWCVESPLPCVSGVTGSDLKRRIEQIMRNDRGLRLNAPRKLVLSAAAAVAVAGPLAIGVMSAPQLTTGLTPISAQTPRFAVASVKRNLSGESGGMSHGLPGGGFQGTNISLFRLIRNAYRLQNPQVIGGPDWMNTYGFDIDARPEGTATPDQSNVMLRALLHDRFALRAHAEPREIPVYAIVIARSDGRLGPMLTPATDPACARPPQSPAGSAGAGGGGETQQCGSIRFGPGNLVGKAVPIAQLANSLSGLPVLTNIDRIILDRSGLDGRYDFDLKWTWRPRGRGGAAAAEPAADDLSIFTALQEQLGLKLEPQRAPVEVLVVDSAHEPTEN